MYTVLRNIHVFINSSIKQNTDRTTTNNIELLHADDQGLVVSSCILLKNEGSRRSERRLE